MIIDFKIAQDANGILSIQVQNATPQIDSSLEPLIIASLFTDRRITAADALPAFFDTTQTNQGGFWGDDYPSDGSTPGVQARPHGSLLWTLKKAKQIEDTRALCILYIKDALQWLIDNYYATAVDVSAWWAGDGYLASNVVCTLPDGSQWTNQYRITA
jgi:phage gp46-like protein